MASLRNKAIKGAAWSLTGRILQKGSQFIIGIFLARLLAPSEYGLVAMAGVFIFITYAFVDSGFGVALIQKKECSEADYSTTFYINLVLSIFFFLLFYFLAPYIAVFYGKPSLTKIIRILSLVIILYALAIVQNSIIQREVNFKLKTRIEFIAQVFSGVIAIAMAYQGLGVWALVWKILINQFLINIQLWLKKSWFPRIEFSMRSFHELFSFSSKLLLSSIINRTFEQIYRLVVGKFFPAKELGFYTRAEQFKNLPSQTVSGALMSFLLPVISRMQEEPERMKNATKKVLKVIMYFNVNGMILLGIIAHPMIYVLLGERWLGTVPFLQLLIFTGILYPVHAINVEILTALGRTDLFLKIELLKKLVAIPAVALGIFVGINAMILGMIGGSVLALAINTHYTKKLINFGMTEQIKSISKSLLISIIMILLFAPMIYFSFPFKDPLYQMIVVSSGAAVLVLLLSKILKMEEYYEIKNIIIDIKNKRYGSK